VCRFHFYSLAWRAVVSFSLGRTNLGEDSILQIERSANLYVGGIIALSLTGRRDRISAYVAAHYPEGN
jgi:hypothetical protein